MSTNRTIIGRNEQMLSPSQSSMNGGNINFIEDYNDDTLTPKSMRKKTSLGDIKTTQ